MEAFFVSVGEKGRGGFARPEGKWPSARTIKTIAPSITLHSWEVVLPLVVMPLHDHSFVLITASIFLITVSDYVSVGSFTQHLLRNCELHEARDGVCFSLHSIVVPSSPPGTWWTLSNHLWSERMSSSTPPHSEHYGETEEPNGETTLGTNLSVYLFFSCCSCFWCQMFESTARSKIMKIYSGVFFCFPSLVPIECSSRF